MKNYLKQIWRALTDQRDLGVNTPGWADYFLFGGSNAVKSGAHVTEEGALRLIAVYSCVSYIADYVASLPKIVYERLEKGKNRAQNHYLYPLIHDQPNPFQNDYEFVELLTGHVLLWGNAYAEIERNGGGQVTALWPLRPDRMRLQVFKGKVYYYYTVPDGGELQLTDVFHIKGLSPDGISGYSPIRLAREAIGLGFAEEEYRARFFSNNGSPGGVLEFPGQLDDPGYARFKRRWEEAHSGLSNAHRVAILEQGMKWQALGIPAKDMEFIEGRKYQKAEIASLYRIKPYKIGILEPGTVSFASIEQQAIDTHIDTMRPWVIRWEKKITSLLTESEKKRFFVEFLIDAVLRGDTLSRFQAYQVARQNGWMNANEIRALENMNPIPGRKGDEYWRPSNMTDASPPEPLDLTPVPMLPANGNGKMNGAAE